MLNKSVLAFALLHIAVSAICVIYFGANPIWVIGGLVFSAAIVRSLHPQSPAYQLTTLCILSGLVFLLSLMLGASYYMQGEGFNDSFFYHLNSGSLIIAARSYASAFYPAVTGVLLALLTPLIIRKSNKQEFLPKVPAAFIWALALFTSYPIYSLIQYEMSLGSQATERQIMGADLTLPHENGMVIEAGNTKELATTATESTTPQASQEKSDVLTPNLNVAADEATAPVPLPVAATPVPTPKTKKNIILIYAESLESLYFDTEIFGELLPNIRELSADAHRFTNMRQVRGTGWTIAGIVASQCGFPLVVSNHLASNSSIASVEKPYPDEVCMADILSEQGYDTVFMGGAPLWFGGKGNFLKTHGYKRVFGDKELTSPMSKSKYQSDWGLYDDSLFGLALRELETLETSNQPYMLTLLTLDTHHPYGLSSKSCTKLEGNSDSMSNAIYCSDQLVSQFISDSMTLVDMNDTIIVLFSDHLSLRNTLWDTLKANKKKRKLTFMIFDHTSGSESGLAGTHMDVGPTVLEAAGLTNHVVIGAGASMFSKERQASKIKQQSHMTKITPTLLRQNDSAKKVGVSLSKDDLSISVGNLTLKANDSGERFVSGMFMAAFDDQGIIVDAIYSDDYESLAKNLSNTFVVGLSILENQPGLVSYFYGRISLDGRDIVQKPLVKNTHLSGAEIIASIK